MAALFLGVLVYVPLWGQNLDFTPDRPDGPAKIQSALWELATPGAAKPTRDLQDTVVVILVPHLGQASASIDTSSLATLGGRVLAQSKSLMRVSVPASSLLAVSELPGVRFVRRPYRPHAQQETWSEGGWSIKAYDNAYDNYYVRGQGVRVAIIDLGFKGARHLSGDMPARWWSHDFTGEGIYTDDESVHGTACAEIIHDVAPEAEFYLYKVRDLLDLENAKDRCIQNGVDIISHSMSSLGTGIGDGKGIACDIVNDAADKGILWVNSAGNSAKSHYYQPWSDSDSDGNHNFKDTDETLEFEAEKGTEISVYLTWNDWPETRDDYNLHLFFSNPSGDPELDLVAKSTNIQSSSGGKPVEVIEYNAERSGQYHIVVTKSQDARSRRLKIWSLNRNLDFEYSSPERSIGIPADAEGAMSVGAIYYGHYNLGRIADYSSRGPTLDGRFKPELVAPTGVSTVSYAPDPYHGTSAAAPHVAGAAALIKSANPSYSRTQLWDALVAATVDIGDQGRDNDSGYGKLVLPIMQVSASPQITSVSPSRVRYNQVVTIRGTAFGANRGTSKVTFYGGTEPSSFQYVSWSDTQIQVRVPTGARTGNLQVVTTRGSDTARLTITSPWVRSISPQTGRTNTVVTVNGENFGSSRGSSSVLIGSVAVSSFTSWSSRAIQFRIPLNTPPGNLTVKTSEGTSNFVRLEITSPYLTSIWPTQVKTGDRLTLTGGNFSTTRGTGYVLFASNVRPSAVDYVSWSDRRIVVEVPDGTQSGNVQIATSNGTSGAKRLEIDEQLEPLPSRGLFGYSPPTITKNPKSVEFGFEGIGEDVAVSWALKNDAEVGILVNGQQRWNIPVNNDWQAFWGILSQTDLNSGQNVIEFRNRANQNRTSSFTHWQLKDVKLWKPINAKLIAGAEFLGSSRSVVESGLGDPFPTPFNAEVTIPFVLAEAGPVRLTLYNLMGQQIRVLADGWVAAGAHSMRWDGRTAAGAEAASGVYWAVLQAEGVVQTAQLALIR